MKYLGARTEADGFVGSEERWDITYLYTKEGYSSKDGGGVRNPWHTTVLPLISPLGAYSFKEVGVRAYLRGGGLIRGVAY